MKHFSLAFSFLFISCAYAQNNINTWPLFEYACDLDSNSALYRELDIHTELDSQFVKGRFYALTISVYDDMGRIVHLEKNDTTMPQLRRHFNYLYSQTDQIIATSHYVIEDGDTTEWFIYEMLYDDSITGKWGFERTRKIKKQGLPIVVLDTLVWHYVETDCKRRWADTEIDKQRFEIINKGPGYPNYQVEYGFRGRDTLYRSISRDEGLNSYAYDTTDVFLDSITKTRTIQFNSRLRETITWTSGVITEHHVYVDSVEGMEIRTIAIFNKLQSMKEPELIIEFTDTVVYVRKQGQNVLEDYIHLEREYFFPPAPMPPVDNGTSLQNLYPYCKAIPLANGDVKLEYYNFYTGTIRPLLIVWKDKRGVIYKMQSGDSLLIRKTE